MLSKNNRLQKDIYKEVFDKGKSYHSPLFLMKYTLEKEDKKFSVVVPKKVYKNAVDRNELRRFVYDVLRENIEILKPSFGIFVIKKEYIKSNQTELRKDVLHALHKTIGFNL